MRERGDEEGRVERYEELRERLQREPAIAPSILAADFAHLGDAIAQAEKAGAASVHFDVMDGRFVPNISIGLPVLTSVRRATTLPIETHLMIVEPERYAEAFAHAGADIVTVHTEATAHLNRVLTIIREVGAVPGVTLNPATPLVMIEEVLPLVGLVLVMSINPGFGGQAYLPASTARLARLAEMRAERGLDFIIEVDGGINATTIRAAAEAGCDLMVAGTAVFAADGTIAANMDTLRAAMR